LEDDWEYRLLEPDTSGPESEQMRVLLEDLDEAGADGWKAIQLWGSDRILIEKVLLKRPISNTRTTEPS
jgi:hypothetical protein